MVYVLSVEGKPLMPTKRHGKVRRLLKQQLAKLVKTKPFTIQLLYETTNYTQNITLGIDSGY
ncbi:MAG TPA: RRXRR domain-containing protein, partial [Fervidobacterium sp.]|nr:RRXRR domain-containing protein [Fervidobacterium sp.]